MAFMPSSVEFIIIVVCWFMQEIVENSNINHSSDMKISVMAAMLAYNEELRIGAMVEAVKPYVDTVVVVESAVGAVNDQPVVGVVSTSQRILLAIIRL